jgi:ADP-ribose pyrophosphatase YjhB (NUDIX family)
MEGVCDNIFLFMKEITEEHFFGKVAQKAVIIKDGNVLLVRDPREEKEIWELPGGRLNVGEDPKEGLAREIFEELGVDVDVHDVLHVEQFLQGSEGNNTLMIAYRASLSEPEAVLLPDSKEIAEVRFVPVNEVLDLNLFPEYRRTLEAYQTTLN